MAQEVDPEGDRTIGKKREPSFQRTGREGESLAGRGISATMRDARICTRSKCCPRRSCRDGVHSHTADAWVIFTQSGFHVSPGLGSSSSFFLSIICIHEELWMGDETCLVCSPQWSRKEKVAHQFCHSLGMGTGEWGMGAGRKLPKASFTTLPGQHWCVSVCRIIDIQSELFRRTGMS